MWRTAQESRWTTHACTDRQTTAPLDGAAPDQGPRDIFAPPEAARPDKEWPLDSKPPDLVLPTCHDGEKNGAETDADCGGPTCSACADGKKCGKGGDCVSTFCINQVCRSSCKDGVANGAETDADCGGGSCPACAAGNKCKGATDCASEVCTAGICAKAGCADKVKNGAETDLDCGGPTCSPCADKMQCKVGGDCNSGVCVGGFCAGAGCTDLVKNGTESDVDCGGPTCPPCGTGKKCSGNMDCLNSVCGSAGTCLAPTCNDKVKNGKETGTDCGGGICPTCGDGKGCAGAGDCASGVCTAGTCAKASCADAVKNGHESDVDCGGTTCPACGTGKKCANTSDCISKVCAFGTVCLAPTCSDKVKNGGETDVDCGGPTCSGCALGKGCSVCADCAQGSCATGKCKLTADCLALIKACPKSKNGLHYIDPNGGSTADAFLVFCLMSSLAGGGWTQVATTADDAANTWSYDSRALLWNQTTAGSTSQLGKDYKSSAYFTVPFKDMAFIDAQGNWAVYDSVNNKTGLTVRDWMPKTLACATAAGRSFKMTAGNLKATKPNTQGKMNSTILYMSIYDNENCSCTPGATYSNDAWGPTWSYTNNNTCGADDPAGFGWGTGYAGGNEMGTATLGDKQFRTTETNTGDYIKWFVR